MSDWIIKVENLGKRYRLRHQQGQQRYVALRDVIADHFKRPFRAPSAALSATKDFWALKGVSFDIKRGEVVGIIGRNGAGKSTLLKILSRITEPTEGQIRIKGRVASLLEVGTGFHPELTGRENIYLNGSILGMSRAEIKAKFDDIVGFAETEKFLDTPVKRYSSGMYVRLAFAVAAHLEPEILIVDEVLAVGDAAFQKKCLGKLQDVAGQDGRTVLFVSHNLDSILRLCSRVFWLNEGSLREMGRPADVVHAYSRQRSANSRVILLSERQRPNWVRQNVIVREIICPTEEAGIWTYPFGSTLDFACVIAVPSRTSTLSFGYAIHTSTGFEIASARARLWGMSRYTEPGRHKIRVCIPNLRLAPGNYSITVGLRSASGEEDYVDEAALFEVVTNEKSAGQFSDTIKAACIPESRFIVENLDEAISLSPISCAL